MGCTWRSGEFELGRSTLAQRMNACVRAARHALQVDHSLVEIVAKALKRKDSKSFGGSVNTDKATWADLGGETSDCVDGVGAERGHARAREMGVGEEYAVANAGNTGDVSNADLDVKVSDE